MARTAVTAAAPSAFGERRIRLRRRSLAATLWTQLAIAAVVTSTGAWKPMDSCLVASLSIVRRSRRIAPTSSSSSSPSSLSPSSMRLFHHQEHDDSHTTGTSHHRPPLDRRKILSDLVLGSVGASLLLLPEMASAGIDVSGLKIEANPLDVFLGGTYYEDDGGTDDGSIDGRISRRKYFIVDAPKDGGAATTGLLPNSSSSFSSKNKKKDFFEDLDRPVLIQGESTSISSSRDDPFELRGNLFLCKESRTGGCIVIDFSPLGGPSEVKGYWDATEGGIRFADSQKVWSKQ